MSVLPTNKVKQQTGMSVLPINKVKQQTGMSVLPKNEVAQTFLSEKICPVIFKEIVH